VITVVCFGLSVNAALPEATRTLVYLYAPAFTFRLILDASITS
jgi:hypothetical protein